MDSPDLKATIALDGEALAALLEAVKGAPDAPAATPQVAAEGRPAETDQWTPAPVAPRRRAPGQRPPRRW